MPYIRWTMPSDVRVAKKVTARGYITKDKYQPDLVPFVTYRRGPKRPVMDSMGVRAQMDRYAEEQGIRGSLPELLVHYALTSRGLEDGTSFDFQCLAGHHRVLTADLRWVPISELGVGQRLLGFTENRTDRGARTWETGIVLSNKAFVDDGYNVFLSNGSIITTTVNHPWLAHWDPNRSYRGASTSMNWITTEAMASRMETTGRGGFWIPMLLRTWEHNNTWKSGWVAGFFDGEGSIIHQEVDGGHSMTVTASQNAGETLGHFVRLMAELGFEFSIYDYRDRHYRSYDSGFRQVMHLRISGGRSEALRFLGTIRPKKMNEKLDPNKLGRIHQIENVRIESIVRVRQQEFYGLEVSNKTYLAEGFGMHNSSQLGGRLELGGMICDFKFLDRPIILRVQGEYFHEPFLRMGGGARDEDQKLYLEYMGYFVYDLWESDIMNADHLDDWMARHIW